MSFLKRTSTDTDSEKSATSSSSSSKSSIRQPTKTIRQEKQKELDALYDALTQSFISNILHQQWHKLRSRLPFSTVNPWALKKMKLYEGLEIQADSGEHDCGVHGGRECFCWRFEFRGKRRVHDVKKGWVGLRTPFAED